MSLCLSTLWCFFHIWPWRQGQYWGLSCYKRSFMELHDYCTLWVAASMVLMYSPTTWTAFVSCEYCFVLLWASPRFNLWTSIVLLTLWLGILPKMCLKMFAMVTIQTYQISPSTIPMQRTSMAYNATSVIEVQLALKVGSTRISFSGLELLMHYLSLQSSCCRTINFITIWRYNFELKWYEKAQV